MRTSDYLKKYEDIGRGVVLHNAIASRLSISMIGHFGSTALLTVELGKAPSGFHEIGFPLLGWGNMFLGYFIKLLLEVLGMEEEDGVDVTRLRNFPLRLVIDPTGGYGCGKILGFGHLVDDKFLMLDDLQVFAKDLVDELKARKE